MIKSVKEIASSSNIPAPIFRFRNYDRGQTYYNDGQIIDFVTDGENLYVPVVDSTPNLDELRCAHDRNRGANEIVIERGVVATKDSPKEDDNFMLLVSRGPQGIQGIQGKPGKDGKTPSVFARFDGKQMVFYTVEDVDGVPTKRRIAATNDLTGPAWKPELIDDTIVWRKTKDDEAPRSIPLNELRANATPILLRVNSDNTKREDETSGPANYIQWKYEGQPYWNNLISISELMNLTLAGVTIFPVQNPETGKTEYHLGHKEVTKATYDSTPEGKQIITDVELGQVLFDAGPIPFPEYNYEYDIAYLKAENCDRIREIRAIQLELPKFVRSVNEIRPDPETGNVELEIPNANDYIKKEDLKFEVREEENGRYLYVSMDNGNSWTQVMEATCACTHEDTPTVIPVTSVTLNCPDSPLTVGTNRTLSYIVSPSNATNKNVTFSSSDTSVATVTNAGVVTPKAAGTTTITVTTVDGGKTSSCTITVNNPAPIEPTGVAIDNCAGGATVSTTKQLTYRVLPTNASDKSVTFTSSNTSVATVSNTGLVTAVAAGTAVITVSTWNNKTATCTVTVEEETPEDTLSVSPSSLEFGEAGGEKQFTVTTNVDSFTVSEDCDWIETDKDGNTVTVTATSNDGNSRSCDITVEAGSKIVTVSVSQEAHEEAEPTYYTLTVNGNGAESITVNGNSYTEPMQIEEGTRVIISASRDGYTPSYSENNFDMIKNTSVDITWTEVQPDDKPVTSVTIGDKPTNNTITWNCSNNQTHTLSAIVAPSDATRPTVTWNSSNTSVATINITTGVITVVGPGTTTITASADSKSDSFTLTINRPTVTSISLNKSSVNLNIGDTQTLTATLQPSCATGTVTWSSNNTSVATVSNTGLITAIGSGTATITASVNGKTDSCNVTVNAITYHVNVNWTTGCEPDSYYITTDKSSSARETEIDAPQGSTVYLIATKQGFTRYEETVTNLSNNYTFNPPCSIWDSVTINNCIGNDMSTNEESAEHVRNLYAKLSNVDVSNENVTWEIINKEGQTGRATIEATKDSANKDCGKVTALGAGVVTARVTSKINGSVGECIINIVEEDPIMVSGVTIMPSSMDINISDTSTSELTAIVSGTGDYSKAVTWSVTPASGLLVTPGEPDENGNATAEIKGNTAGSYTVTATSVQDTYQHGSATVTVTGVTKNIRLVNNSPWTVSYSVGNSSNTITTGNTIELGTVSEDMTIQRVYPDQAQTYFTLQNGTNTYSQSGNMSSSYSGNNWVISYENLQSGDITIDYETGIGPILE